MLGDHRTSGVLVNISALMNLIDWVDRGLGDQEWSQVILTDL